MLGAATSNMAVDNKNSEQTKFNAFISNATSINVTAFDVNTLKQVPANSLSEVVSLMESNNIQPGSFKSRPDPYGAWASNQLLGDEIRSVDLSDKDAHKQIADMMATDIQNEMRQGNVGLFDPTMLVEIASSEKFDQANPSQYHKDFQPWLSSLIEQKIKNESISGYSIYKTNNTLVIEAVGVVDSNSDSHKKSSQDYSSFFDSILEKAGARHRVSASMTQYDTQTIELNSSIGPKGSIYLDQLRKTASDPLGLPNYEVLEKPTDVFLMALPQNIPFRKAHETGYKINPGMVKAMSIFQSENTNLFQQQKPFSEVDLLNEMRRFSDAGIENSAQVRTAMFHERIGEVSSAAQNDPVSHHLRSLMDQPCSPGAATQALSLLKNTALESAKDCATGHGYAVDPFWAKTMEFDGTAELGSRPVSLLGFKDGTPVFIANGRSIGAASVVSKYSFADASKDKIQFAKSNSDSFVMINPHVGNYKDVQGNDKNLMFEFMLEHELGHVKERVSLDGAHIHQTSLLRNVREETNVDVYAAKKMLESGHSKDQVMNAYMQFVNATYQMNETELNIKPTDPQIQKIMGMAWAGQTLVQSQDISKKYEELGNLEGVITNLNSVNSEKMSREFQKIELIARHANVKDFIDNFELETTRDALLSGDATQQPMQLR